MSGVLTNPWMAAAAAVIAALAPCALMCLTGGAQRRLVGMEMAGMLVTIAMVLLAIGSGRQIFVDLPLALAVMSFGGGLVFARFLEKHL